MLFAPVDVVFKNHDTAASSVLHEILFSLICITLWHVNMVFLVSYDLICSNFNQWR